MQAHIFYPSSQPSSKINLSKVNPTKMYCKHLSNYFELRAIANNAASPFAARQQANAEMLIAERKMRYWERKPNFSNEVAVAFNMQLKREFAQKRK